MRLLRELTGGITSLTDPFLDQKSLNHCLPDIKAKTLIMWGDKDTLFPYQTAFYMKNKIPNSEIHLFQGVGHCPQIEMPRAFSKVYRSFLKSL